MFLRCVDHDADPGNIFEVDTLGGERCDCTTPSNAGVGFREATFNAVQYVWSCCLSMMS